jgi:hypothetical protein
MHTGFLIFMAAACIGPARGQDQSTGGQPKAATGKPSAKEMFLTRQIPYVDPDETPNPKPKAKSAKAKQKSNPAQPPAVDQAQSGQPAQGTVPIVPASYSGVPLGLRYTVQKTDGERNTDVPADTEFHSGDHIQLNLEVNDTGFLYVIAKGSTEKWRALLPSSEIENGDNSVQRGHVYTVPPGKSVITFDDTTGKEHLFVILSRQRVQEIDSLIFSLKGGRQAPAADTGGERPAAETLTASARPIEDSQIAKMRAAYTRDLIIEDLGHQQTGEPQQDKSVYVVNPKGSADSRVVADILLNHEK